MQLFTGSRVVIQAGSQYDLNLKLPNLIIEIEALLKGEQLMFIQLTNAGVALITAATQPVVITSYRLGSAYGYTPSPTDTGLHGTLVYTGSPSGPLTVDANTIKYGIGLDYDVQTMSFGEVAYYVGSTLFALGSNSVLINKVQLDGTGNGNSVRIDAYLSMVGTNYNMWGDIASTSNKWQLATLQSVDQLPPSAEALPNAYIIEGADLSQSSYLAYTNRSGTWDFDAYAYANTQTATVVAATTNSVTIAYSDYNSDMFPQYFGQIILQFTTGQDFSICRYVTNVGFNGTTTATFNLRTPMQLLPVAGDKIRILSRQALSTSTIVLPIATATVVGGVKVGSGLSVTLDGTLSVNPTAFPVTSVNGKTGAVVLQATDIGGFATVATTGNYNDLSNKPAPYVLPIASTSILGGVKSNPTSAGLAINGQGVIDITFSPVKSVNNNLPDAGGNVTVTLPTIPPGLINPTVIPASSDLNTFSTVGLFYCTSAQIGSLVNTPPGISTAQGITVEVVPITNTGASGACTQRVTNGTNTYWREFDGTTWSSWVSPIMVAPTATPATTSTLGSVIVGSGLSVTGLGVLSTNLQTVNGKSPTSGNVQLTATDVAAIPTSQLGIPGGVATLTITTGTAQPTDFWTYGRIPVGQIALGTVNTYGIWNASTNVITDKNGNPTKLASITNGGLAQYVDNTAIPAVNQQVDADGTMLRVGTAGTTSVDGNATWAIGDMLVSFKGQWVKFGSGSGGGTPLQPATVTVLGGVKIGYNVNAAGDGTLTVAEAPNLLVNGSGELGTYGLTLGTNFAVSKDVVNGYVFTNTSSLSSVTTSTFGAYTAATPSTNYSFTTNFISTALTAGTISIGLAAYDSSQTLLSTFATQAITVGATGTFSVTGATPASTAYVRPVVTVTGASCPASGFTWNRMKVAPGTRAYSYSQEADIVLATSSQPGLVQPSTGLSVDATGKLTTQTAYNMLHNGSAEFGFAEWNTDANWVQGYTDSPVVVNTNALSSYSAGIITPKTIFAYPGATYTGQVYMINSATAGTVSLTLVAYNSGGTIIGGSAFASATIPANSGYTTYSVTGIAPTGTVAVAIDMFFSGVNAPAGSIAWGRTKITNGTAVVPYSAEGNFIPATAARNGMVRIGTNLTVDATGLIAVPTATTSVLGAVSIAPSGGIQVSSGSISLSGSYTGNWAVTGNISATGTAGFGATTVSGTLGVSGTTNLNTDSALSINGSSNGIIQLKSTSYSRLIYLENGAGQIIFAVSNGSFGATSTLASISSGGVISATDFTATSDASMKDEVRPITGARKMVRDGLQGVYYRLISTGTYHVGFIAQNVEPVVPQLVTTGADGIKRLSYGNATAILASAHNELEDEFDQVKMQLADAQDRLAKLEAIVAKLTN